MYIYMYISMVCIYIYIYINVHIYVYMYTYIYNGKWGKGGRGVKMPKQNLSFKKGSTAAPKP